MRRKDRALVSHYEMVPDDRRQSMMARANFNRKRKPRMAGGEAFATDTVAEPIASS
jgi:hypothetical protein